MEAACRGWLGDGNQGARRQPQSRSGRVNITFEVKGLNFQIPVPSAPQRLLWFPEFSWSTYSSGLGSKLKAGLFKLSPTVLVGGLLLCEVPGFPGQALLQSLLFIS